MIKRYKKNCPICGSNFFARDIRKKFCSLSCASQSKAKSPSRIFLEEKIRLQKEHEAMMERLRKRDEEYERNFPDAKPKKATWRSNNYSQELNECVRRFV